MLASFSFVFEFLIRLCYNNYVINYVILFYDFCMSRQIIGNENVRKLTVLGQKSFAVTIPIEFIREFGWEAHEEVVVKKRGKRLIIKRKVAPASRGGGAEVDLLWASEKAPEPSTTHVEKKCDEPKHKQRSPKG